MRLTYIAIALSLSACSGGGGSSGPTPSPPPPPPPPTNTAPSVSVIAPSAVDERQTFTIDASGSTDADGDTLSYSISLSGSSNASLTGSTDGPIWTVQTTEVTADETIDATITVSDGTTSSNQSISITIANYDRTPLNGQWGSSADQLTVSNAPYSNLASSFVGGPISRDISFFTRQSNGALELQSLTFATPSFPAPVVTSLIGGPTGEFESARVDVTSFPGDDLVVWSATEGVVQIYKLESDGSYSNAGNFSIPDACSAQSAFVGDDRGPAFGIAEYSGLIIGTPNGLTALLNNGNPREDFRQNPGFVPSDAEIAARGTFSNSRVIATTGDYCALGVGSFNQNGTSAFGAYSETRSELTLVTGTTGNAVTLGDSVPVTLPTGSGLNLIDQAGGRNQDGTAFAALLFSDGEHTGTHQLVILHQDANGIFSQTDISLPNGVPADMVVGSIDVRPDGNQNAGTSDFDSDIIIAVPETPYVYVIKNTSSPSASSSFAPLEYLEVGFGVDQLTLVNADGSLGRELVTGNGSTLDIYVNTEQ